MRWPFGLLRALRALGRQRGLSHDLRGQALVREPRAAEDGQLLSAHEAVGPVYDAQAGLDELARVVARSRIDRPALDVLHHAAQRRGAAVKGPPQPVEDAPEHPPAHPERERPADEAHPRASGRQARRALQHLHYRRVAAHLQHGAQALTATLVAHRHQLIVAHAACAAHEYQRPVNALQADILNRVVLDHRYSASNASNSASRSRSSTACASASPFPTGVPASISGIPPPMRRTPPPGPAAARPAPRRRRSRW